MGLAGGVGDMGGDFRCSGLGVMAGFSLEEGVNTMCLGLSGLSLRTTLCLAPPFSGFPFFTSETTAGAGLEIPFCLSPMAEACWAGLNPFTFGATSPAGRLGVTVMPPLSLRIGITLSAVSSVFSDLGEVTLLTPFPTTPFFMGLTTLMGRILSGVTSSTSRLMGMILSLLGSSPGTATLQLLCFSCSLNSGLSSRKTAGTFRGLNSMGELLVELVSIRRSFLVL